MTKYYPSHQSKVNKNDWQIYKNVNLMDISYLRIIAAYDGLHWVLSNNNNGGGGYTQEFISE